MSNGISKIAETASQARRVVGRIDNLETDIKSVVKAIEETQQNQKNVSDSLQQLVDSLNKAFQNHDKKLADLAAKSEALENLMGAEDVQNMMQELAAVKLAKDLAEEKARIAEAVEKGFLKVSEVIGATSMILGKETLKDGTIVGTGYSPVAFVKLDEKYQQELLGKPVGTTIDTPVEGKFVVLEIYDVDEEKAKAFLAEQLAQQQTAAPEAPEAVPAAEPVLTSVPAETAQDAQ